MRRFILVALLALLAGVAENPGPGSRSLALTSPASRFGSTKPHEPFAVIMDVAGEKGVVSVLATSSGDAALYLSTGGAITSSVPHDPARQAALDMVAEAGKHMPELKTATKYDYPKKGSVSFFVRTPEATLTETVPEATLQRHMHPLSPLYAAGQKVISELRRLPISK